MLLGVVRTLVHHNYYFCVGISSLFNLMTNQQVAAENYPFCTIDPTEAKCPVPDQRFKFLCELYQ